jgi:hypothetical protein
MLARHLSRIRHRSDDALDVPIAGPVILCQSGIRIGQDVVGWEVSGV